ncbi:MAG: GldM family protein [Lacibacter sp.]
MKLFFLSVLFSIALALCGNTQTITSNDLFRKIYIGIENPISIMPYTVSEENVSVVVDIGRIRKTGSFKYAWEICTSERSFAVLKIYNKNELIDSIVWRIILLPDPILFINQQNGEIFFKGMQGIRSSLENSPIENIKCTIQQFTVSIEKRSGKKIDLINYGNFYSEEVTNAFNALKIGDKVTLSNFSVFVGCETRPRQLKATFTQVYSGKKYEFRY